MAYVFVADHVSQEEVIELQIKKLDKPTRYACSICNKFVSRNARKVYLHIHDKHNKENRYILFSEWWTCKDDECEYYTFRRECALHHAKKHGDESMAIKCYNTHHELWYCCDCNEVTYDMQLHTKCHDGFSANAMTNQYDCKHCSFEMGDDFAMIQHVELHLLCPPDMIFGISSKSRTMAYDAYTCLKCGEEVFACIDCARAHHDTHMVNEETHKRIMTFMCSIDAINRTGVAVPSQFDTREIAKMVAVAERRTCPWHTIGPVSGSWQ